MVDTQNRTYLKDWGKTDVDLLEANVLDAFDPIWRLIYAITVRAVKDLDSDDIQIRRSAELYFLYPPDYLPDVIAEKVIKERERIGKPFSIDYATVEAVRATVRKNRQQAIAKTGRSRSNRKFKSVQED